MWEQFQSYLIFESPLSTINDDLSDPNVRGGSLYPMGLSLLPISANSTRTRNLVFPSVSTGNPITDKNVLICINCTESSGVMGRGWEGRRGHRKVQI